MTGRSRSTDHQGAAAHQRTARIAALALSTLAGCGLAPGEDFGSAVSAFSPMCSQGRRWVADVPTTACNSFGNWAADPILGSELTGSAPTYCAFEWQPTTPVDAPGLAALATHVGSAPLAEDCMFVGSLGELDGSDPDANARTAAHPPSPSLESFGQELREDLRLRFAERAGAIALPRSSSPEPTLNPASVRVAVVDSEPDAVDGTVHPGRLRHGAVMAGLVRDLSCPGWSDPHGPPGACVSDVLTHLALPHVDAEKIDRVNGGEFGTIGELASAITAAVDRFRHDGAHEGIVSRLVINLSVGVQPSDDACAGDPSQPGAKLLDRVLHATLQRAACHGAIIVTAAGNDPGGGPYTAGGTCPAAWASLPAPSRQECEDLFGVAYGDAPRGNPPDPTDPQAPLVYAVHGVDASDTILMNARDGARGWIAAPGLLGASPDGSGELPAPLSGSSVAAAAVSGIAATVWAYRPELSSREVMDLVHASGVLLEEPATLCPPDAPPLSGACRARRASLCDALVAACDASHGRCPTLPSCPSPAPLLTQNTPLDPHLAAQLVPLSANGAPGNPGKWEPADQTPSDVYPAAGIEPWVRPQPTSPPCGPACVLDLAGWLYLSINPAFDQSVRDVTLRITGTTPTPIRRLGSGFVPGTLYTFPMGDLGIVRSAALSFEIGDGTSTSEQILIRR